MRDFVSKGDEARFNDFKTRVENHGHIPPGRASQAAFGNQGTAANFAGARASHAHAMHRKPDHSLSPRAGFTTDRHTSDI